MKEDNVERKTEGGERRREKGRQRVLRLVVNTVRGSQKENDWGNNTQTFLTSEYFVAVGSCSPRVRRSHSNTISRSKRILTNWGVGGGVEVFLHQSHTPTLCVCRFLFYAHILRTGADSDEHAPVRVISVFSHWMQTWGNKTNLAARKTGMCVCGAVLSLCVSVRYSGRLRLRTQSGFVCWQQGWQFNSSAVHMSKCRWATHWATGCSPATGNAQTVAFLIAGSRPWQLGRFSKSNMLIIKPNFYVRLDGRDGNSWSAVVSVETPNWWQPREKEIKLV